MSAAINSLHIHAKFVREAFAQVEASSAKEFDHQAGLLKNFDADITLLFSIGIPPSIASSRSVDLDQEDQDAPPPNQTLPTTVNTNGEGDKIADTVVAEDEVKTLADFVPIAKLKAWKLKCESAYQQLGHKFSAIKKDIQSLYSSCESFNTHIMDLSLVQTAVADADAVMAKINDTVHLMEKDLTNAQGFLREGRADRYKIVEDVLRDQTEGSISGALSPIAFPSITIP